MTLAWKQAIFNVPSLTELKDLLPILVRHLLRVLRANGLETPSEASESMDLGSSGLHIEAARH